jgi:ABC-2 type transport system permease protein
MSATTYVRFEILRTFRNTRFFLISLVFPLVLYYLVAGANRDVQDFAGTGVPFPVYYMIGMVSWGAMAAVIAGGARIAAERSVGWNRQLRLTPLKARTYLSSKLLSGYALALVSIGLLYGAGLSLGVRMAWDDWARMTALVLIGLVPFAAMGILLGHVLTVDSMGPAIGGITALLALLGGAWGPIGGSSGVLHDVVQLIPSYWLVQAADSALSGGLWPLRGWVVMAVWTAVLAQLAAWAYRRDTARV